MPTYDYSCKTCEQHVNISRGINDKEQVPQCLKCQAQMSRVFVAPPIVFNGQGFNTTNG